MKMNEKGITAFEILVVIVLYAAVFSIISLVGLNSANKTKFKALKYDAVAFSYNVRTYLTYNKVDFDGKIYLSEIVKYDDSYNITSPFDADHMCSLNDSYVVMKNNTMYVTLKCDDYMLYEYDIRNTKYEVYHVGAWEEEKPAIHKNKVIDQLAVYNYKKNNNYVLDEFVPLEILIDTYNANENRNVTSINTIDSMEEKIYYRERKVVSNVVD